MSKSFKRGNKKPDSYLVLTINKFWYHVLKKEVFHIKSFFPPWSDQRVQHALLFICGKETGNLCSINGIQVHLLIWLGQIRSPAHPWIIINLGAMPWPVWCKSGFQWHLWANTRKGLTISALWDGIHRCCMERG